MFHRYLDKSKRLIRWFAQNAVLASHPKLEAVPIGLENRHFGDTKMNLMEQSMMWVKLTVNDIIS